MKAFCKLRNKCLWMCSCAHHCLVSFTLEEGSLWDTVQSGEWWLVKVGCSVLIKFTCHSVHVGGDCGRRGKGKSVCGDNNPAAGGPSMLPFVAGGETNETRQWAKTGKVKLRNWQPLLKSREGTHQGFDLVRATSCKLKTDFHLHLPCYNIPRSCPELIPHTVLEVYCCWVHTWASLEALVSMQKHHSQPGAMLLYWPKMPLPQKSMVTGRLPKNVRFPAHFQDWLGAARRRGALLHKQQARTFCPDVPQPCSVTFFSALYTASQKSRA